MSFKSAVFSILLFFGCAVTLGQPHRQFSSLNGESTSRLLEKGQSWLNKGEGADSALVCFTLAASRYNTGMTREEKEQIVRANIGKWLVYFSYLYDYPKAYESLQTAIKISEEAGINKAKTHLSMGGMMHMLASQSNSEDLYQEALTEYSAAMREAIRIKDENTADLAFVNMLVISRAEGVTTVLDSVWQQYRTLGDDARLPRRHFSKALYRAISARVPNLRSLADEIKRLPEDKEFIRLRFIGLKTISELSMKQGDTSRALNVAEDALELSQAEGMRDAEQEARLLLSDIYHRIGDESASMAQRDQYLRIKEETMSAQQLHRLEELRFLSELRTADEQLTLSKETSRRHTIVIFALSILVVMAIVFIRIVIHKNRRLRQAHDSLSQRLQATLADDERERRLLHHIAEIDTDTEGKGSESSHQSKYEGSSLGDKERIRILSKLADIAADPEIICTPGCSIGKLAEAIGCNTKYLSQIINDEYNCNFNAFINEIRIKEACRRILAGGEWDRLTMEAIANSVGFKSRSTFSQFFKQVTGMTPTEFRRHK